jgi:hypothetical protein
MGTTGEVILSPGKASEFEQSIAELPGIRAAKVELSIWGEVAVRIVMEAGSDRGSMVQAVRTLGFEKLGIVINEARITVLRAKADGLPAPVRDGRIPERTKLCALSVARLDGRFKTRVGLRLQEQTLYGESDGPEGEQYENHSVALATLGATKKLKDFAGELEAVEIMKVGMNRVAVVTFRVDSETYVGSARVRRDEYQAIARAVLDALNRIISTR